VPSTELPHRDPAPADDDAAEALWRSGRDAAREDVRSIFAPRRARCPTCGAEEASSSGRCPRCGTAYAERRRRGPSRRGRLAALAGAVGVLAVAGVFVLIFAPGVRRVSDRAEQLAAHRSADTTRATAAALTAAEAPRFGRGPTVPTGAPAATLAARAALLRRAEGLITGDVSHRAAAGLLDRPARATVCSPTPDTSGRRAAEGDPAQTDLTYSCLAEQAAISPNATTAGGEIGLPFDLRMHTDTGALAWCAVQPPAGERGLQADEVPPPPSPACAGQ